MLRMTSLLDFYMYLYFINDLIHFYFTKKTFECEYLKEGVKLSYKYIESAVYHWLGTCISDIPRRNYKKKIARGCAERWVGVEKQ